MSGLASEAAAVVRDLSAAPWWRSALARPLFRTALLIALAAILADQTTKLWVLHGIDLDRVGHIEISKVFDLSYVENRGVSFGLFAGGMVSRIVLTVVSLLVSAYVLHWLGTLYRRVAAIGGGLIVGGALGNVIDRVAYGYVVDFLNFEGLGFPFVFNVADAAINLGVACLLYDALVVMPRLKRADLTGSQDAARFPDADAASMSDQEQGERSVEHAAGTDRDATGDIAGGVHLQRDRRPERP